MAAPSAAESAEGPLSPGLANVSKQQSPNFGFSLNLKSSNPAPKRPHIMLDDGGDDDEEQEGAAVEITTFGDTPVERKEEARVIAPLADTRTWGGRAKRQKSSTPQEDDAEKAQGDNEAVKEKPVKFGLHVPAAQPKSPTPQDGNDAVAKQGPAPELSADEEAIAHLTGQVKPTPQRTVLSEDDAFRRDTGSAPSDPTLEDYKATPIEGFGAALMRGYLPPGETLESWKEKSAAKRRAGAGSNRIDKDGNMKVERRGDLLGLGAKELDLGVDGGAKKKQSRKAAMEYEPLARRNMKTGEIIGEKEFQKLVERESSAQGSFARENGDGSRDGQRRLENGERSRRDRERDRDDDSDRARRRHRHRERDGHDERRDRERDRDRDERRDRDRDRDRDVDRHRRHREAHDEKHTSRRHHDGASRDADRHHSSRRSREHEHRERR